MSLVVTATAIKQGLLLLPKYESAKEVLDDWLALYEELREKISGGTAYLILRNPKLSDDFAHSLNMATCCLWFTNKCFPDLSSIAASELSEEDLKFASPSNPDWDLPV
jgi:CDP-glycerol glycerophosphotransferase (TagB/SpsB family)